MQQITTQQTTEDTKSAGTSLQTHTPRIAASGVDTSIQNQSAVQTNAVPVKGERFNYRVWWIEGIIMIPLLIAGAIWAFHTVPLWFGNTGITHFNNPSGGEKFAMRITAIVVGVLSWQSSKALAPIVDRWLTTRARR